METPETEDNDWTTGNDPDLSHKRIIDMGAFGEVHELRNEETGEAFARKLIRGYSKAEAENELRAVAKLCQRGAHKNIVCSMNWGKLPRSPFYFLDMELCDFNLTHYIKQCRHMTDGVGDSQKRFVETGCIFKDISDGIAFIHLQGEIHRDLKPRNILYSSKDQAWKIADFGLTTEGTSKRAQTTLFSRGTAGYRAPELIQEKATYTNKVDIWAMGCILFELVFLRPAFANDFAVDQYYRQNNISLSGTHFDSVLNTFPETALASAGRLIQFMLRSEASERPDSLSVCKEVDEIFPSNIGQDTESEVTELLGRPEAEGSLSPGGSPTVPKTPQVPLLVWVDDIPANNTGLVLYARQLGIQVVQLLSTAEAKTWIEENSVILHAHASTHSVRFVTDNSRFEKIENIGPLRNRRAGYQIISYIRRSGFDSIPILVFTMTTDTSYVKDFSQVQSTTSMRLVYKYIEELSSVESGDSKTTHDTKEDTKPTQNKSLV